MLSPGTRIGRYELVAPLGAGGMGEVYRAWDDRFQRAVAIKVLPADMLRSHDRLDRFVCEARIAGQLNHRNVLSVYDVELDETPYLVSELLDGETLRQRMRRGALAPHAAVQIALQMAAGLAAIHDTGVVHRDLKPENVFLTHDGLVKILDFGLAQPPVAAHVLDEHEATVGERQDGTATFSRTVAYLSPEQVRGGYADHRSDLFAIGAILFEALSGIRAFDRDSRAATIRAILEADPFKSAQNSSIAFRPGSPESFGTVWRRIRRRAFNRRATWRSRSSRWPRSNSRQPRRSRARAADPAPGSAASCSRPPRPASRWRPRSGPIRRSLRVRSSDRCYRSRPRTAATASPCRAMAAGSRTRHPSGGRGSCSSGRWLR